eukprot:1990212-Pyramimonas_sp.AAC.1
MSRMSPTWQEGGGTKAETSGWLPCYPRRSRSMLIAPGAGAGDHKAAVSSDRHLGAPAKKGGQERRGSFLHAAEAPAGRDLDEKAQKMILKKIFADKGDPNDGPTHGARP